MEVCSFAIVVRVLSPRVWFFFIDFYAVVRWFLSWGDLTRELSAPNLRSTPFGEHRVLLEDFAEFFKGLHTIVTDLNFQSFLRQIHEHVLWGKMSMGHSALSRMVLALPVVKEVDLKQGLCKLQRDLVLVGTCQRLRRLMDQVKERHSFWQIYMEWLLSL